MNRCDTNRDLFDKRILRVGKDIIAEQQDPNKVTTHDLLIMMLKKTTFLSYWIQLLTAEAQQFLSIKVRCYQVFFCS